MTTDALSTDDRLHSSTPAAGAWPSRGETALFVVVAAAAFTLVQWLLYAPQPPIFDAMRYIDYAVNVVAHGVFGLTGRGASMPTPGMANTPLYPLWVAFGMVIDPDLARSLTCIRARGDDCPTSFGFFVGLQGALAVITLALVFLTARRIGLGLLGAWLAAAFVMASGELHYYANRFLTEIVMLPLFFGMVLCGLVAWRDRRARWLFATGMLAGLLVLARPAYVLLVYAGVAVTIGAALWPWRAAGRKTILKGLVLALVGYALVTGPWLVRNKVEFDRFALTASYTQRALAQRVAYNQMSWTEVAVAFVYWFPDGGDSIARKLFDEDNYRMLGWDRVSYYRSVAKETYQAARQRAGSDDGVLWELILNGVLRDPVKHTAVSMALAWRGLFVAKYWGVVGFTAFIFATGHSLRRRHWPMVLASLPAWFMVAAYAGASVSIARYNLPLLSVFGLAMAYVVDILARRWMSTGSRPRH